MFFSKLGGVATVIGLLLLGMGCTIVPLLVAVVVLWWECYSYRRREAKSVPITTVPGYSPLETCSARLPLTLIGNLWCAALRNHL